MLTKPKKIMTLIKITAAITVILLLFPGTSQAQNSTTIESTATFSDGVQIGNEADIDFNNVEFAAAPGIGDTVSLGTNGAIAYAGTFGGIGTGTPGNVDVTVAVNGLTVEVFCDQTAILSNGGGASIDVIGIEAAAENATGAYSTGGACNGVAGAAATSLVLTLGVLDSFKFGGQLDGTTAAGFVGGSYSTGFAGGNDLQVDVFYQ